MNIRKPPLHLASSKNEVKGSFTASLNTNKKGSFIKEVIITNKFGVEVKHIKYHYCPTKIGLKTAAILSR